METESTMMASLTTAKKCTVYGFKYTPTDFVEKY